MMNPSDLYVVIEAPVVAALILIYLFNRARPMTAGGHSGARKRRVSAEKE